MKIPNYIIINSIGTQVCQYDTQEEAEKVASGLGGTPPYYIYHLVSKVDGYDLEQRKHGEIKRM